MEDKSLTVRTATNQDTEKIVILVKNILSEFDLVYNPESSEQDLQNIEEIYMKKGGIFEVIENEKKEIIGTVALLKIDPNKCKMRKMYVNKKYRNQGLGHILMKRMIKIAKDLGYNEIILETVHTMTAAINLYNKYGFRKIEGLKAASPRCDITMSRNI